MENRKNGKGVRRGEPCAPGKAYAFALRLLAYKPRTERELREKMARKAFSAGETARVLERLMELGYVDDQEYARRRAELDAGGKRWGPRLIEQDLRRRGIDRRTAVSAVREAYAGKSEEELAAEVARDKIGREGRPADGRERARLIGYLTRKGFTVGAAVAAVRDCLKTCRGKGPAREADGSGG